MNNLQDLLIDGIRYDPRYLPSLNSDHLPMTLCAITGLGGTHDFCLSYRKDYIRILREIPSAQPLPDWHQGIGERDAYPELLAWFRKEVDSKGIGATVSEYLPRLIDSLPLDAFHPIIRLGYAIDFESPAETAAALAYLTSSHHTIPVDSDLSVALESELKNQARGRTQTPLGHNFSSSILALLDSGEYPTGRAAGMSECAAAALDIYRSTRNFFALHMVTATQAVRVCSPLVDEELAVAALTGALLAAHKVVGSPDFDRDGVMPVPDRLDREHTYKYAWACLSEHRHYGDERYADEIRGFREKGLIADWSARDEV